MAMFSPNAVRNASFIRTRAAAASERNHCSLPAESTHHDRGVIAERGRFPLLPSPDSAGTEV